MGYFNVPVISPNSFLEDCYISGVTFLFKQVIKLFNDLSEVAK